MIVAVRWPIVAAGCLLCARRLLSHQKKLRFKKNAVFVTAAVLVLMTGH